MSADPYLNAAGISADWFTKILFFLFARAVQNNFLK